MKSEPILASIPPSKSDLLLHSWGYDLVKEYYSIVSSLRYCESPVLELATGTGRMCAVLSCIFPIIVSGDLSLIDLPRAKNRIPNEYFGRVHFVQLNMEQLPFLTDSVRKVVCLNTMHELVSPQACLQEMIRVLHPDGTMIVGDFNTTGFDVMQRIHEIIYFNNHSAGTMTNTEIEEMMNNSFYSVQMISTALNNSFVARKKK